MGTRHLVAVVAGNEFKIANYGQFDGYPSGQGVDILKFLREDMKEGFKEKVLACSWITQEQHKQLWVECGADPDSDMVGIDVSNKFKSKFPWLHRECGSDILVHIQDNEHGIQTTDSTTFAADSLFCEYAYVIDLDKNTFEIYKGFNKTKLGENERFAFLNAEAHEDRRGDDQYFPVSLMKSYNLDNLPTQEQFLEDLTPPEEDDE